MKKQAYVQTGKALEQNQMTVAEKLLRQYRRNGWIRRSIAFLSAVVILFTMSTLRMDAVTLSRIPTCGYPDHTHTEECYKIKTCELEESDPVVETRTVYIGSLSPHTHTDLCLNEDGLIACGFVEGEYYHEHNRYCYNESGKLVCGLKENKPHEHNDSCYTEEKVLTCALLETEGHTHDDNCYTSELTCGQEESIGHQHTDKCYTEKTTLVCEKNESEGHVHTDACYTRKLTCDDDHEHDDSCYEDVLTCGKSEGEGAHTHTDECYETISELTCGKSEGEGAHTHTDECYTLTLTCDQDEEEAHIHTDECYETKQILACDQDDAHLATKAIGGKIVKYVISLDEDGLVPTHIHNSKCFETAKVKVDGKEETVEFATCGYLEIETLESTKDDWTTEEVVVDEGHQHNAFCYALDSEPHCGLHEHTEACYQETPHETAAAVNPDVENDDTQNNEPKDEAESIGNGDQNDSANISDVDEKGADENDNKADTANVPASVDSIVESTQSTESSTEKNLKQKQMMSAKSDELNDNAKDSSSLDDDALQTDDLDVKKDETEEDSDADSENVNSSDASELDDSDAKETDDSAELDDEAENSDDLDVKKNKVEEDSDADSEEVSSSDTSELDDSDIEETDDSAELDDKAERPDDLDEKQDEDVEQIDTPAVESDNSEELVGNEDNSEESGSDTESDDRIEENGEDKLSEGPESDQKLPADTRPSYTFSGIEDAAKLSVVIAQSGVKLTQNKYNLSVSETGKIDGLDSNRGYNVNNKNDITLIALDYFDEVILTLTAQNKKDKVDIVLKNPAPQIESAPVTEAGTKFETEDGVGSLTLLEDAVVPEGTELTVAPTTGVDASDIVAETLGADANIELQWFEIAFGDVQEVAATVTLNDVIIMPEANQENENITLDNVIVLHDTEDGVEVLDSSIEDAAISFDTNALGTFGVAYTLDYTYTGYLLNIRENVLNAQEVLDSVVNNSQEDSDEIRFSVSNVYTDSKGITIDGATITLENGFKSGFVTIEASKNVKFEINIILESEEEEPVDNRLIYTFHGVNEEAWLSDIINEVQPTFTANQYTATVSDGTLVKLAEPEKKNISYGGHTISKDYTVTTLDYFDEVILTMVSKNGKDVVEIVLKNPAPVVEAGTEIASADGKATLVLNSETIIPEGTELTVASTTGVDVSDLIAENFVVDADVTTKWFDISLGDVHELNATVTLNNVIDLPEAPEGKKAVVKAVVFHVTENGIETLDANVDDNGSVTFTTRGLSPFGISWTVDYEYTDPVSGEKHTFSMPGEGTLLLSELFSELHISTSIYDVTGVTFTDYRLLSVEVEGSDWRLTSKHSFQTNEVLTVYIADGTTIEIHVTDAISGTHADMAELLTSVSISIDGQNVTGSTWEVKKGQSYEVTLNFQEEPNTSLQLDTNGNLTYQLPPEFKASSLTRDIELTYVDEQGRPQTLSGNSFTVDPDTNTVTLNLDADAKTKIEVSGKTSFQIKLFGSFDQNANGIEWSENIKRNVNVDDNHNLAVEKTAALDSGDKNYINYTVKVTSTGYNKNVHIEDTITGTALTLVEGSVHVSGANNGPTSTTPVVATDGNTIKIDFASLNNNEEVYVTYKAKIDRTKLTGTATAAETSNGVKVTGTDVTEQRDSTDFAGKIAIESLSKGMVGYTGDGSTKTATWRIVYNADHLADVVGRTVTDTIDPASQTIMKYTPGGEITIKRFLKDEYGNEKQEGKDEVIPYTKLTAYSDSSWTWTVPQEDASKKYRYEITYSTDVEVGEAIGKTAVKNNVEESGGGTAGGSGEVGPGFDVDLSKALDSYDADGAEWVISFKVPADGLSEAVVKETLPEFGEYLDEFDNVNITNMDSDETYTVNDTDPYNIYITFYKDAGKTQPGLKGTGAERTITLTVRTKFDKDWLEANPAGTDNSTHYNNVVLNGTVKTQAEVTPVVPELVKTGAYVGTYNGLPVYKFTLDLRGFSGNADMTITDTYDNALTYLNVRNAEGSMDTRGEDDSENWGAYEDPDGNKPFSNAYFDEVLVSSSGNKYAFVKPADIEESQGAVGSDKPKFTITIPNANIPRTDDNSAKFDNYYPAYTFSYYLIVKDQDALSALNTRSVETNGTIKLSNTANWNGSTDGDTVTVDYEYPAVEKTLLNKEEIANKTVARDSVFAQFQIILNKDKQTLNGGQPMTMTDDFSNLSVNYQSIRIEAVDANNADRSNEVVYDYKGTTGTFTIPDATKVTITYEARVTNSALGVETPFGNTAKMKGYKDSVSEKTTVGGSASGNIPVYSIRVFKYDGTDMRTGIAGAVYQLTDANGNPVLYPATAKPATDKSPYIDVNGVSHGAGYARAGQPITFRTTTDYGTWMLDQDVDGISFQLGQTYHFKETKAPDGYQLSNINYTFTLSESPDYDNWEYYSGDIVKITDSPKKGVLEIGKDVKIDNASVNDTLTEEQKKSIVFTIEMVDENGDPVLKTGSTDKVFSETLTFADFTNGKYRFEDLEEGTYKVTETNYNLTDLTYVSTTTEDASKGGAERATVDSNARTFTFVIPANEASGAEHVVNYANSYTEADYKINIKKVSGSVALFGAEFKVEYKANEGEEYAVLANNSAVDANGTFTIPYSAKDEGVTIRSLKNGFYRITETKSPDGYRVTGDGVFEFAIENGTVKSPTTTGGANVTYAAASGDTPAQFTVNNGITYGYTFTKHEKGSASIKLKGAEFTTYEYNSDGDDTVIQIYTTDADGNFEII